MKTDVIIVGSGIIGNSPAYELRKRGKSVLVLEDKEIGHGASSRNVGGVRQSARDINELPLAMYAVKNIWSNLSEELDCDIEYVQKGGFRLAKNPAEEEKLKTLTQNCRNQGLEVNLISGDEAREICPAVPDDVTLASLCPTDGHANPYKTTLAYYMKARELGAHFITGEKVVEIVEKKGRTAGVRTESGEFYESDFVIVAAGYDSRKLLNTVDLDVPMNLRLLECAVTEKIKPLFPQMMAMVKGDFFLNQTKDGSLVINGLRTVEPWIYHGDMNNLLTSMSMQNICNGLVENFKELKNIKIVREWAGYADKTPDILPVIDRIVVVKHFCNKYG